MRLMKSAFGIVTCLFRDGLRRAERELCFLGMLLILAIAILTSTDVFGRYVFASPISGVPELSSVLFVIGVFLSLAYTQAQKSNIRVEILLNLLPHRVVKITKFIMLLLALLIMGLVTWGASREAFQSTMIREVDFGAVGVPLWPAKIFFPIGTLLLCLRLLVDAINELKSLRNGRNNHGQLT